MVLDAAGSVGTGWPIFSALHAESPMLVKYVAAVATIGIAVAMLELTIRYVAKRSETATATADGRVEASPAAGICPASATAV